MGGRERRAVRAVALPKGRFQPAGPLRQGTYRQGCVTCAACVTLPLKTSTVPVGGVSTKEGRPGFMSKEVGQK